MRIRGRKPLWIAIIVVVAWLGVSGAAGPLFGKLSTVQKNDNSDFLPKNAESYKFTEKYKAFAPSEYPPTNATLHPIRLRRCNTSNISFPRD